MKILTNAELKAKGYRVTKSKRPSMYPGYIIEFNGEPVARAYRQTSAGGKSVWHGCDLGMAFNSMKVSGRTRLEAVSRAVLRMETEDRIGRTLTVAELKALGYRLEKTEDTRPDAMGRGTIPAGYVVYRGKHPVAKVYGMLFHRWAGPSWFAKKYWRNNGTEWEFQASNRGRALAVAVREFECMEIENS